MRPSVWTFPRFVDSTRRAGEQPPEYFRTRSVILGVLALTSLFRCVLAERANDVLFQDEFEGATLNTQKWNTGNETAPSTSGAYVHYLPSNVIVRPGSVTLTANRFGDKDFVSGRIDTRNKFTFTYGHVEIRAKFPPNGKGIWSSLRLRFVCAKPQDCVSSPPLVSIAQYRFDISGELRFSVAYGNAGKVAATSLPVVGAKNKYTDEYQLYGLKWTATKLEWFLNRESVFVVDDILALPTTKMSTSIEINLFLGGVFPGGVPDADTKFPAEFSIREVVVRKITETGNGSEKNPTGTSLLAPLLGSLLPLALIAAIVAIVLYKKRSRFKNVAKMKKTSEANSMDVRATSGLGADWRISDYMKGQQGLLDYVNLLEVPLANLEISDLVLGEGKYGIVRKGTATGLRGADHPSLVAVKSARDPGDEEQQRELVEEMKIMCKAGRHLNILNLVGAVITGKTLLLTELCPLGSLLSYLRDHRGTIFSNDVDSEGVLLQEKQSKLYQQTDLQQRPLDPIRDGNIATRDLIDLAFQSARGMEYLAYRGIIHRDLAARNVLVAADRIAKVSDFGMARQQEEYVLADEQVALPVRWMPPEAIMKFVFNQKTDVWSFGVLMWEIFTLAETPYHDFGLVRCLTDFVLALAQGYRMPRPSYCPVFVYQLMQDCWKDAPNERPNFDELTKKLQDLLEPDAAENYLTLDIPYQRFNGAHRDILDTVADEYQEPRQY